MEATVEAQKKELATANLAKEGLREQLLEECAIVENLKREVEAQKKELEKLTTVIEQVWGFIASDCGPEDYEGILNGLAERMREHERLTQSEARLRRELEQLRGVIMLGIDSGEHDEDCYLRRQCGVCNCWIAAAVAALQPKEHWSWYPGNRRS